MINLQIKRQQYTHTCIYICRQKTKGYEISRILAAQQERKTLRVVKNLSGLINLPTANRRGEKNLKNSVRFHMLFLYQSQQKKKKTRKDRKHPEIFIFYFFVLLQKSQKSKEMLVLFILS